MEDAVLEDGGSKLVRRSGRRTWPDATRCEVLGMVLAHHPYDYITGFAIALVGILLIIWAERRAKSRHRSDQPEDRS